MGIPESRFTVLVSTDGGVNWRRHAGIIGSSADQAIKRVREGYPDYEVAGTLFYATQRFTPRQWEKQMVEKWGLQTVEDLPAPPAPGAEGATTDD